VVKHLGCGSVALRIPRFLINYGLIAATFLGKKCGSMSSRNRWILVAGFAVAILGGVLIVGGCKKKETATEKESATGATPAGETVAQVHWLGKDKINAETNSGYFIGVWNLPQSQKLQSHFLDQLALAPLHVLLTNQPISSTNLPATQTNHPSFALLRPLLDDLMTKETFLELSKNTKGSIDAGLAIRLDAPRSALWTTNLPQAFKTLSAAPGMADYHVEIDGSGDWTFIGLGQKDNPAVRSLRARLSFPKAVLAPGRPEFWLEGDVKLAKLFPDVHLPIDLPQARFAMIGQTQGVASSAAFDFPRPLPFDVEPWMIPTNLVHGPIHTFTAIQGLGPLLSQLPFWKDLGVGEPPNQLLFWGHVAHPALTYVAAPMTNAKAALPVITDRLLTKGNDWLTANGTGEFEHAKDYEGVFCTAGNPLLGPFLQIDTNSEPNFLIAGWGTSNSTNMPPPEWLFAELEGRRNLVFYDREMTGGRMAAWFYLAQGLRVMLWKAQLPFDSPSIEWLASPGKMFGPAVTRVTKSGPNQLVLERYSSVGLNSFEMQFLADWLESPSFPLGLHTTALPGMKHRPLPPHTNTVPPSATSTNR
jgi:hypothetical protein